MKKIALILSLFLFGTAFTVNAQEMTQKEKNSYSVGVILGKKIAEEIQKSGIDLSVIETIKEKIDLPAILESIDFQSFKFGLNDILKGDSKLPKEEVEAVFARLQEKVESIKKMFESMQTEKNSETGSSSCTQSSKKGYLDALARNYGSISWYYIFIKEYKQSEKSARLALNLDPTQTWVNVNLAHALLFQNQFSKAEKIYKELITDKEYIQTLLKDFDDLEKAGAIPEKYKADVKKIRKMLLNSSN
jgi:tetratricopeptide (TPR) repeat protein